VVADTATSNPSPSLLAGDIWIWDVERGQTTRLTISNHAASPVWMPDGKRVCFRDDQAIRCQNADGSGEAQTIATIDTLAAVRAITPDGKMVLSTTGGNQGSGPRGNDIVITTVGPPATTRPLLHTTFLEGSPAISPDGRWIAYSSNETGRNEIYVRPFPDVERGKSQVSIDGGVEPRWAPNGRELFFYNPGPTRGTRTMSVVPVQTTPTFVAGKPAILFPAPNTTAAFDLSPDGRFLFSVLAAEPVTQSNEIVVVQNWIEELKARMKTQ
jgi:Tol biopolymer transport system component